MFVAATAGALSSGAVQAQSRGIKVLTAGSTLPAMKLCTDFFSRSTGVAVSVATDHGHNIRAAVAKGAADADVIVIPTEWVNEAVAAGHANKDLLVSIGSVRIGAAMRDDSYRLNVASMDGLRSALTVAPHVLLTLAPTGDHLMKVIERMGLTATVAPKLKRFDTATQLNQHIADNQSPGALGFGPTTEIIAWRGKGVMLIGTVPDEIQVVLPYHAAILTRTTSADFATIFLAYLATQPARQFFRDTGVE
jgi:molybdate transport system substrate-binding protein